MADVLSPVPQRSQVSVKTAMTVALTGLAVVALALMAFQTRFAWAITIASALLATALHHLIDRIENRGVERKKAIWLVVALTVAVAIGIALLVVPSAVNQATALVAQLPELMQRVKATHLYQFVDRQLHLVSGESRSGQEALQAGAAPALRALSGVMSAVVAGVSIFFLTLFMVIFGGAFVRALVDLALPVRRVLYQRVLRQIYVSIGGYIAGISLICAVNASMATLFLAIMRVPFFLPLGLMSGLSSVVPYAGPVTAGTIITLVTLTTKGSLSALAVAIYFVLYGQLEGQILGPLVFERTVHVNPLVTLLAVLFLAELAGVMGAVIAVPAAAAVQIIVREWLIIRDERLQSSG